MCFQGVPTSTTTTLPATSTTHTATSKFSKPNAAHALTHIPSSHHTQRIQTKARGRTGTTRGKRDRNHEGSKCHNLNGEVVDALPGGGGGVGDPWRPPPRRRRGDDGDRHRRAAPVRRRRPPVLRREEEAARGGGGGARGRREAGEAGCGRRGGRHVARAAVRRVWLCRGERRGEEKWKPGRE